MADSANIVDRDTSKEVNSYDDNEATERSKTNNVDCSKESNSSENCNEKGKESCCKVNFALLPCKVFFFMFFSAISSVFPYLSLYYKQIGFSPNQIGVVAGVRPLVGFCSGPLWGTLADKFRVRRGMLLVSTVGWLVALTAIGFVPPPIFTDSCDQLAGAVHNIMTAENANVNLSLHSLTKSKRSIPVEFSELHISPRDLPSRRRKRVAREAPYFRKERQLLSPDLNRTLSDLSEDGHVKLLEDRGWMYDSESLLNVFIVIMLLVVVGEFTQSPTTSLADSGTIEQLGPEKFDQYGHQRAWGPVGASVAALAVGAIINTTRKDMSICGIIVTISDYRIAFIVFAVFMALTFVATTQFKFEDQEKDRSEKKPTPQTSRIFRMFFTFHYGSFLFSAFVMGMCNGVIWGFLYWHLENLGASQLMIGVCIVVVCVSEVFMFLFVFQILAVIGYLKIMYLGLLGYAVRFFVYSIVENPWWVLPTEILKGVTFSAVWCALTGYTCSSVPRHSLATVQGILHGVYWGLGSGSGHMLGGLLIEIFGAPITFQIFAGTSLVALALLAIIQCVSEKPEFPWMNNDYIEVEETK